MSSPAGGPGLGHSEHEWRTTVLPEPQVVQLSQESGCLGKRNEYLDAQFVELRRRNAAMEVEMASLKQRLAEKEAIIERLKVRLGSRSLGLPHVEKL